MSPTAAHGPIERAARTDLTRGTETKVHLALTSHSLSPPSSVSRPCVRAQSSVLILADSVEPDVTERSGAADDINEIKHNLRSIIRHVCSFQRGGNKLNTSSAVALVELTGSTTERERTNVGPAETRRLQTADTDYCARNKLVNRYSGSSSSKGGKEDGKKALRNVCIIPHQSSTAAAVR